MKNSQSCKEVVPVVMFNRETSSSEVHVHHSQQVLERERERERERDTHTTLSYIDDPNNSMLTRFGSVSCTNEDILQSQP